MSSLPSTLVIALPMVVLDEFADGPDEGLNRVIPLGERHLRRSHEPFRVRVGVRHRLRRQRAVHHKPFALRIPSIHCVGILSN